MFPFHAIAHAMTITECMLAYAVATQAKSPDMTPRDISRSSRSRQVVVSRPYVYSPTTDRLVCFRLDKPALSVGATGVTFTVVV